MKKLSMELTQLEMQNIIRLNTDTDDVSVSYLLDGKPLDKYPEAANEMVITTSTPAGGIVEAHIRKGACGPTITIEAGDFVSDEGLVDIMAKLTYGLYYEKM